MCVRTGRDCPGIPDGPMIVDMTKTAKHGMKKRKAKPTSEDTDLTCWVWMSPDNVALNRIPQKAMMTEAFYGRFLTYFTSEGEGTDIRNRFTWLHRLPLLSMDGTNNALVLAIQATASAYCAADTANPALTRHAWDLYGEALRMHSWFLARSRSKHEVTIHMVSTSLLFSIFEAMQATSTNAYRSHIYGVAKMLEVTGSGQCQQGVLCQIFYHLRTQMAFVHLIGKGKEKPVEVRKILHGTLEYTRLPMFQRLMSHVSTLTEMYVTQEDDEAQEALDLVEYTIVKTEVDALWYEYNEAAAEKNEYLVWKDPATRTAQYRDAFTALTIAYFESARVLLAIMAPRLAISFFDPADRYAAILQASHYLQIHDIGCSYMRMVTPLLLVALHAPKAKQRIQATSCFHRWKGGNMRGISSLALEMIHQRQTQESSVDAIATVEDMSILPYGEVSNVLREMRDMELVSD